MSGSIDRNFFSQANNVLAWINQQTVADAADFREFFGEEARPRQEAKLAIRFLQNRDMLAAQGDSD